MRVQFYDRQEPSNLHHGKVVVDSGWLNSRIDELRQRPPSFCALEAENGFSLLIGVGPARGCVQFSATDGSPPYLMAKDVNGEDQHDYLEFLTANTDTPILTRYCLPMEDVKQIANEFLETGEHSARFEWEEA